MSEINAYSKNMLRSMDELKKGKWNPGFYLYEFRSYDPIKIPIGVKTPLLKAPIWVPGMNVKNYNIVVTNEQGIGDTIMHSRFIPLLRKVPVKSVQICMQRSLNPLISKIEGVDGVITDNNCLPNTIRVKALSLPALLMQHKLLPERQPEKVYGSEGYLKFNVEKTDKIGFCWRSDNSSWNSEAKKIPQDLAEDFYKKLSKKRDVVSLQVQPDFMPSYLDGKDWLDTAKKIAALDAIVTIDTGVAHLAGALGVRTINLIGAEQYAGWFYYPAQSDKTAWYDSMELVWYEPFTNWKAGLDEALKKLCH